MTLYQFNLLELNDKCRVIWDQGTYLAGRIIPGFQINLYHLGNFYSEVWYDGQDNEIKKVTSFRSKEALEPYLDFITLAPFF